MIVGTHSVLSKEVKFHDLGLSITDEEHRFGVLQREEVQQKHRDAHSYDVCDPYSPFII